jgi:F-type H+-transporting ATPase subunit b
MPQFDTHNFSSQIFWLFLCFGILFLFLQYVIIPKITRSINERTVKIQQQLQEAKLNAVKTEKLEHEYKVEMLRIKDMISDLQNTGKVEINKSFAENMALLTNSMSEEYKSAVLELMQQKNILSLDLAVEEITNMVLAKFASKASNQSS